MRLPSPRERSRPPGEVPAPRRAFGVALAFLVGVLALTTPIGGRVFAATSAYPPGTVPASSDVEDALRKVLALVEAGEPQRMLREAQQTWAASRVSHCTVLARVEDQGKGPGQASATEACFRAMDRQRVDALKAMRIPLLLAQRPPVSSGAIRGAVRIPFDKNRMPAGLTVAATGWLAAVGTIDGIVDLYDLVSGQRLRSFVAERYASYVAFTANARLLLTGSYQVRGLQVWDVHSSEVLADLKEVMGPFVLSPDNRHVFFTDAQRGLGIYDLVGGTMVGPYYWIGGTTAALAVDPAGRRVAAVTFDGMLTAWEVVNAGQGAGLALAKLAEARMPAAERPSNFTFSVDGGQLFAVTPQQRLEIWRVRDLQRQASLQVGGVITGRVERVPNADLVCFPVQRPPSPDRRPPRAEQTIMVVDPIAHEAALLEEGLTARALLMPMPDRGLILVVTQQDLRSVALPDRRKFKALADVVPPTPEPLSQRPPLTPGGPSLPLIQNLGREFRVEAIGVYEGTRPPGPAAGRDVGHTARPVEVSVGLTDRPVVLVLSSYEPVIWTIKADAGARIRHILLSGYADSTVVGVPNIEMTRIGQAYAYQPPQSTFTRGRSGSGGYPHLDSLVLQYVGRSIERFQGRYTGERFSVGRLDAARSTFKCLDASGLPLYSDRPCESPGVRPSAAPEAAAADAGAESAGRAQQPERRGGERVLRCGRDTIVCDASGTVICGGRRIRCE